MTRRTLTLTAHQYDALLAGTRLLARVLKNDLLPRADIDDIRDILTNAGAHDGLNPADLEYLGDAMQAGDLDAPLDELRAIADAALKVDIGAPSKSRLDAFRALSDALVTYNGAPLGFQGRLNPGGAPYPAEARQRDLAAAKGA